MAAIIFDFDGTIADTNDHFIDFVAGEAHKQVTPELRKDLRGLPLAAVSRRVGHPWWRLPLLYYKGRKAMEPFMKDMRAFKGMPEVIRKLHAEGHELFIVSSNSAKNVGVFLKRHNIHKEFFQIYGGVFIFGKAATLRKLLKDHSIELKNAVYVGDELRDMQAAESLKMRAVGVLWGFARPGVLESTKPFAVAATPDDLLRVLEEI
ncbi:MAG TPA: HAD hydrolase-like protein [Candidatus Saccharimonadales bacterium]